MRWPLRYQILVPLAVVTIGVLAGVSILNAVMSTRRVRAQIDERLRAVVRTMRPIPSMALESEFMLNQISGLSGAHYVVSTVDRVPVAQSDPAFSDLPDFEAFASAEQLRLDRTIDVAGNRYFYAAVVLNRPREEDRLLHIFYPEKRWRLARDQAVYPPLLVGSVGLLLVGVLAFALASHVTRPIRRLRSQVEKIAQGEFQPMSVPPRNDEIRDLCSSINQMADMLARYEEQIRQSERLKTLGQLGGGIAHQMRNAATGCRMALDLHRGVCPIVSQDEDLAVATQQLILMEKYLQRFLTLGRETPRALRQLDLRTLVENVLPLVRPSAKHAGVSLELQPPTQSPTIDGDDDALEQLIVNLLLNAIEAASSCENRRVVICLSTRDDDAVRLEVKDSGKGPDKQLGESIFEPLVTSKPDGTGLGLSVVREVAEQHRGKVFWERRDDMTCFIVELPLAAKADTLESE
ncbi:MAG: HAMP domain-containing histidine kinase [Planctomycetes bacterium]|nr:HAMP domain-containing histidine kinase [Planctomycetota bacterium]